MFYEVIYETGAHSVMSVDDEDEALDALKEHHRRALAGEFAGPAQDRAAERIVKVLKYDKHPNDFNLDEVVTDGELKAALKDALDKHSQEGAVHLPSVLADLRGLSSPQVESEPHESNYKMQEAGEVEGWDS